MNAVLQPRMTLQPCLDRGNAQVEHELGGGEISAMSGRRRTHGHVASNLSRHVAETLDGSPCQVVAPDMKVRIGDDNILCPDVFVTCDQRDLSADQVFRSPTRIIDLLSPSTRSHDRRRKFALCRRLDSVQEDIRVDPETHRFEAFRRTPHNEWVLHDMSDGQHLHAASVGCQVALADVFHGVEPPAAERGGADGATSGATSAAASGATSDATSGAASRAASPAATGAATGATSSAAFSPVTGAPPGASPVSA